LNTFATQQQTVAEGKRI